MLAFGLSLLLLLYFQVVGLAFVRWLHASRSRTQDLLLSPGVGVAVTLVPTFLLNRIGSVPVMYAGPVVAVAVAIIAAVIHIRCNRRSVAEAPDTPSELAAGWSAFGGWSVGWRRDLLDYAPFAAVLLIGLWLIGRPMLIHDFDWLSFSNDDMANYALAGDRLLRHGYNDLPPLESLVDGTEYAHSYWYYHVPMMARCGPEMMLAWTCSLTGLSSHQAFMPLICCFHIVLCSAATGMVMTSRDRWKPALCACILLVTSAQLAFGTIYQLVAQDIGLAVLCINSALLFRDFQGLATKALVRHGVLFGITATGQMLLYPEVNPFLGVGFFIYLGYTVLRNRGNLKPMLIALGVAVAVGLLLLNTYTYDVLAFMVGQKTQGARTDDPKLTLFPFFLIPSGFANFWGLVQITSMPPEPGFSITIAVGALLTLAVVLLSVWIVWRNGEPAGVLALVSALLAAYLFRISSGFGLYKLAMFAQVFALPALALAWFLLLKKLDGKPLVRLIVFVVLFGSIITLAALMKSLPEKSTILWTVSIATAAVIALYFVRRVPSLIWLVLILAIPNWRLQGFYTLYSRDEGGGTFNEVIGATRTKVLREFVAELAAADAKMPVKDAPILCDAYNISLTKMMAAYTVGRKTAFPSSRLTSHTMIPTAPPDSTRAHYLAQGKSLWTPTIARAHDETFEFEPATPGSVTAKFKMYEQGGRGVDPKRPPDDPNAILVASTRLSSLLNRRHFSHAARDVAPSAVSSSPESSSAKTRWHDQQTAGNFVIRPLAEVKNHLLFVDSDRSEPYYKPGDPKSIAIYQLERDPAFYITDTMAGVGRYFLLEVLNPEDQVRVVLDVSLSFKGDRQNRVPRGFVIGTERKPFDVAGRGACRLVSPPITPVRIRGRAYVGIDLGEYGTPFTVARTGLMNWFGLEVGLDRRLLVGFGRDISLIGEDQYRAFKPPSAIYVWGNTDSQLRDNDLEFSGVYEDGWMSEQSYLVLSQLPGQTKFSLKGFVGDLGDATFTTTPTLKIDGKVIELKGKLFGPAGERPFAGAVGIGDFDLHAEIPPTNTEVRRRVEITWSAFQQLQKEDTRKAAAKVNYLGFETTK